MNRRGSYWINLLKGLDYFGATLFGIPAGIYISGYVAYKRYDSRGKQPWVFFERAINWMFKDDFHCLKAMKANLQDIKEYYES